MARNTNAIGQQWEAAARAYLEARGVTCLLQRYRCRLGEIDLVCRDGETLVIAEVRARRRHGLISAAASISAAKRRRIISATRHLLMHHAAWGRQPLRFDVVAIDGIDDDAPTFQWIKAAFDAG